MDGKFNWHAFRLRATRTLSWCSVSRKMMHCRHKDSQVDSVYSDPTKLLFWSAFGCKRAAATNTTVEQMFWPAIAALENYFCPAWWCSELVVGGRSMKFELPKPGRSYFWQEQPRTGLPMRVRMWQQLVASRQTDLFWRDDPFIGIFYWVVYGVVDR